MCINFEVIRKERVLITKGLSNGVLGSIMKINRKRYKNPLFDGWKIGCTHAACLDGWEQYLL